MKQTMMLIVFALASVSLQAQFQSKTMKWYNEPKQWKLDSGKLKVTTDPQTDFWRVTYFKYITDNGHFYYEEHSGDFVATVKVTGTYKDRFDQAGLMIRIDSATWIKSGVELVKGVTNISAVFTRQFSDWSVIARPDAVGSHWLKLVRKNDSVELSYSINGKDYETQRLGYFPPAVAAKVGVMAATPDGTGYNVTFENFEVKKLK